MYYVVALIAGMIVYGSLYPWHFSPPESPVNPLLILLRSWPSTWDSFALRDLYVNIELYFPLGVAAFLTLARHFTRAKAIVATLALTLGISVLMELLQVYVPGRTCSLFDLSCDLGGAFAGVVSSLAVTRLFQNSTFRAGPMAGPAVLLLACLACNQFAPMFPLFNIVRLQTEFNALIHPGSLSVLETLHWAAEWFAAAYLMQCLTGRMRFAWLFAVFVLRVALRPFVVTRPIGLDEILGGLIAMLLWTTLPEALRLRGSICILGSVITARALWPFHFTQAVTPFVWIPFRTTFDAYREPGIVLLARQAFDYGAIVSSLHLAGMQYWRAGATIGVLLLSLAVVQHLLGEMGSITEPVLASLITLCLWSTEQWYRSSTPPATTAPQSPNYAVS